MQYSDFLQRVEKRLDTMRSTSDSGRAAEQAIAATLQTLSERLSGGETRNLASQLPEELKGALQGTEEEADALSLEEFYRRVAERSNVDIETARSDASAVMTVLRDAVTPGEMADVMSQLPAEFNVLFRS